MVEYLKASFWGAVARKAFGTALQGAIAALPTAAIVGDGDPTELKNYGIAALIAAGLGVLRTVGPIVKRIADKESATDIPKI